MACVEIAPQYPGGKIAFQNFVKSNIQIPKDAEGIEGKIIVQFAIDTNGNIVNIKVAQSLCLELDSEVIRVMRLMGKWQPATLNGKKIEQYLRQPFWFR